MIQSIYRIVLLCGLLFMVGCTGRKAVDNPQPAVYYWRTNFKLTAAEQQFLATHQVGKMYVRYFDVVVDNTAYEVLPNATITFEHTMPEGVEIIPTVFIVEQVLHQPHDALAERLVKRILQMNETHDVAQVKEVQLDCDWTEKSREACYQLFEKVRTLLHEKGLKLSATIRLHQLRMPPPPVDYGVLMLYNTGNLLKADARNPILDYRDVAPFLKSLADYDLPLCAAYPDYRWMRLFGHKGFKGIVYGNEVNDTLLFRQRSATCYTAIASRTLYTTISGGRQGELHVAVGDSVVISDSRLEEIQRVQQAINSIRPSIHEQIIIYPIDQENITKRSATDYEKIYHP